MTPRAETTTRSTRSTRTTAAPSRRAQAAAKGKDALVLLKDDHRRVEALFEQFESARRADRKQQIVQSICQELTVHAELEEEEFYPRARQALRKNQDLLDEAEVEHASIKSLVALLESGSPSDPLYDAQVTVLKEYVNHHVKEEERQIFPLIRKSELDTAALGQVLQTAKEKLQSKPH